MKVLLITWACDMDDVSEARVAATWVDRVSREHDVTLFAVSRPDRHGCVRDQYSNLEVIEWCDVPVPKRLETFRSVANPGYVAYFPRARSFLRRFLRHNQFDLVHHLSPFAWRYPSPATRLGVPVIRGPVAGGLPTPDAFSAEVRDASSAYAFLRGSDGLRKRFDPFLRRAYADTDHVLMAWPYMADVMHGLTMRSTSVEPEISLETEVLPAATQGSTSSTLELLYVGRVTVTKGVRYAIRALRLLSDPDSVRLTIVGDGPDQEACKSLVSALGLNHQVRFLGWLHRDAVEAEYRRADAFVFPSIREPSGSVVLEAMAHGMPVIVCRYGGPDYIVDDASGFRVPVTSVSDLVEGVADSMDQLLGSDARRLEMGAAARVRCTDVFGWVGKAQRVNQLYADVVTG